MTHFHSKLIKIINRMKHVRNLIKLLKLVKKQSTAYYYL